MFDTSQHSYTDLRDIVAERTRPILAWVGSGVSTGADLPTWTGFRSTLIEGLRNKAHSFPDNEQQLIAVADRAADETNPWIAFEILHKSLGQTTFRDLVRKLFADAYRVEVPSSYQSLWQLGIKGMLTLNLDRLAVRSLSESFPGHTPIELSGQAVHRLRTNLSGPRPIVANLHGVFEDTDTWVLTHQQLSSLLRKAAYKSFIDTCASMFTIVFVGISVDDVAVGGHLERLTKRHVEFPTAFWITHRQDLRIDKWAESIGIRVIRYRSQHGDHSELAELFSDLTTFVPRQEPNQPPVHSLRLAPPASSDAGPLPPEDELLAWPAEDIRRVLNRRAQTILADESQAAYANYELFSRRYDQAIYRAWYMRAEPGKNMVLGYTLDTHVARGAFGNVYQARDPNGQYVAVKVLLDEVRTDPQALQSFRRGVRSMRILERHGTVGTASYLAYSEIPAFVVMDWIEGPNLAVAKHSWLLQDWSTILDIAVQFVGTIRRAHGLPERVLHRDIRPQNIMLRDYWAHPEELDVVVLDFDLSWHVGAEEKSLLHSASVGYLAPEQIRNVSGISTRSALVDSFGIGMTLYFLCGGEEPMPDQHRHVDWQDQVRRACAEPRTPDWRSLPARFRRLILAATRDAQFERSDLAEIERELTLLHRAVTLRDAADPEVLVEELAARTDAFREYQWNDDRAEAIAASGTGLHLGLRADLAEQELRFEIQYTDRGATERSKLNRYIADLIPALKQDFGKAGWEVASVTQGYADMKIIARIDPRGVTIDLDGAARKVDAICDRLAFDRV